MSRRTHGRAISRIEATNLDDRDTQNGPGDAYDLAFLEHLRANGVRLGTQQWDASREIGKQRPRWMAFGVRIFRRLRLIDD
jgi:hypothetical protein